MCCRLKIKDIAKVALASFLLFEFQATPLMAKTYHYRGAGSSSITLEINDEDKMTQEESFVGEGFEVERKGRILKQMTQEVQAEQLEPFESDPREEN